ncbi:MAG: large-conductance mechanosensitive channel [Halothiobacillus sp. 14-56-357]|jgi:large conductance mechanosensitive channel|uniref:large-conductance mechanosensitive channel protein MscL n=1 Tax=Pseudomonadota TaxID=1224 RepID=UPI000BD16C8B|nr:MULTISPECIES: large-conductance mechanosensitive channel protein MscL [Pseudomonadota]OZB36565.1 MAG: large-conductance mechanosensitive channel [Halothiobacillus sp. 15-55-196]OZB57314.1 MAG: large-conductance mechanosensitive channel [Halothiobacillus sp. 14-56-357]OZB79096.1 MAG: large-conductance mechanosensitive channel [Halothiobacillus sp. 13-55-115]
MSLIKEFKEFAMKGNVIDMAVGIIIGAAFGKIVSSLVSDIIMPPIGVLIGGVDFSKLSFVIQAAHDKVPEVAIRYGEFIQTTLDFTIVAFAIFMALKVINKLKRPEPEAKPAEPVAPPADVQLLTEIRDLLKNKAD